MRVLVVEDSDADYLLIEHSLGNTFNCTRATSLRDGLPMACSLAVDLVILDLSVDDSSGFCTFEKAHAALGRIPILVMSGLDDEELAVRAVASGAQDYVPKSRLLNYPLDRAARYAVERRHAEDAARASEYKYQALMDILPTTVYTCDPNGLITYYNKTAIEFWGRSPRLNDPADRFTGSFKLFTPDGAPMPHTQSWMARALAERKAFNGVECVMERPDGERRNLMCHANPVLDENQNLIGGINVLVDITRQRQAEKLLSESERFARAVVNSLSTEIAILDQSGTIIAVNRAWQRFVGQSGVPDGFNSVGTNYLDLWRETEERFDFAGKAADGIRSVLDGRQSEFYLEYPCESPTGEQWFAMRATPFDGDGPTRVVVAHEDISARKTAQRLAAEQHSLRAAVTAMEQVLGVVGHELRTPLASLRAISEFLTTDGARNAPEADEFLHTISREVSRMSDTVNNILEAARLNSGRARWIWSEVDVESVIRQAIESIGPLFAEQNVQIFTRIDPAANRMTGDADAIRRLLVNLLTNALKHTPQGQIHVSARGVSNAPGRWINLVVEDTGCGIPPELTARLGEAFSLNAGVVGVNQISGAGLGLAICKGISRAHGGELVIESVLGKGTTVTARLRADLETPADGVDSANPDPKVEK